MGGILICDYWLLRRTRLSLEALFRTGGRYRYVNGTNIAAAKGMTLPTGQWTHLAATIGVAKSVPPAWDRIYTYAWFVTFAIAFVAYGVLMAFNRSVAEDRDSTNELSAERSRHVVT